MKDDAIQATVMALDKIRAEKKFKHRAKKAGWTENEPDELMPHCKDCDSRAEWAGGVRSDDVQVARSGAPLIGVYRCTPCLQKHLEQQETPQIDSWICDAKCGTVIKIAVDPHAIEAGDSERRYCQPCAEARGLWPKPVEPFPQDTEPRSAPNGGCGRRLAQHEDDEYCRKVAVATIKPGEKIGNPWRACEEHTQTAEKANLPVTVIKRDMPKPVAPGGIVKGRRLGITKSSRLVGCPEGKTEAIVPLPPGTELPVVLYESCGCYDCGLERSNEKFLQRIVLEWPSGHREPARAAILDHRLHGMMVGAKIIDPKQVSDRDPWQGTWCIASLEPRPDGSVAVRAMNQRGRNYTFCGPVIRWTHDFSRCFKIQDAERTAARKETAENPSEERVTALQQHADDDVRRQRYWHPAPGRPEPRGWDRKFTI
jgi:hypothetical protein